MRRQTAVSSRRPARDAQIWRLKQGVGTLPTAARAAVGRGLDVLFTAGSTLPPLPADVISDVADNPVLLPSPTLFGPGNQELVGLLKLVLIARAVRALRVFEIGTYNGLTALTLAANLPDARVETLDLPAGGSPALSISRDDAANVSMSTHRIYVGTEYESRIVQHFGDSATFDFNSAGRDFDLVYIDGAHTFDYVENDTRAAFSIVSPIGAVVWDDYWRRTPDVARFLRTVSDRAIFRIPGTRLAAWIGHGGSTDES